MIIYQIVRWHSQQNCKRMASQTVSNEEKQVDIFDKFPQIQDNFHNFSRIGEGTFSTVYQGSYINENNLNFAFKVLVPTSGPDRVEKEIQMLRALNGKANIINLLTCMRCEDIYVLVMPHFPHQKFQSFFHTFTPIETQKYMRSLLEAIAHVHKYNIIHRDIKPSNFLYNRISGQCRLVDFGLAQFLGTPQDVSSDVEETCHELRRYKETTTTSTSTKQRLVANSTCSAKHKDNEICNMCIGRPSQQVSRAGTPGFRAPEVLMKYTPHTVAVDVWAAGIILVSILSRRYPFFKSQDDNTALGHIATIFGTDALQTAAQAMGKKVTCQPYVRGFELKQLCMDLRGVTAAVCKHFPQYDPTLTPRRSNRLREKELCSPEREEASQKEEGVMKPVDAYTDDVYNLVKSMLSLNPHLRITASQALEQPFFKVEFEKEIKTKIEE